MWLLITHCTTTVFTAETGHSGRGFRKSSSIFIHLISFKKKSCLLLNSDRNLCSPFFFSFSFHPSIPFRLLFSLYSSSFHFLLYSLNSSFMTLKYGPETSLQSLLRFTATSLTRLESSLPLILFFSFCFLDNKVSFSEDEIL